jgi:hypothetical protein
MDALAQLLPGWAVGAGAALVAALGLLWRVWRAGTRFQRNRDAAARLRSIKAAQEIDRAINNTDPARLRDELKQKWSRK